MFISRKPVLWPKLNTGKKKSKTTVLMKVKHYQLILIYIKIINKFL